MSNSVAGGVTTNIGYAGIIDFQNTLTVTSFISLGITNIWLSDGTASTNLLPYFNTASGAITRARVTFSTRTNNQYDITFEPNTGGLQAALGAIFQTTNAVLTQLSGLSGTNQLAFNSQITGGTVTSFSAGDFSPLFTTSEATATTTPALTFVAVNQASNAVFVGPLSGAVAAPAFRSLATNDLPPINLAVNSIATAIGGGVTGVLPAANGGVGAAWTIDQNAGGFAITNVMRFVGTRTTVAAASAGTNFIIDCALGADFKITAATNWFLIFSNVPPTNISYTANIQIRQDATGGRSLITAGLTNCLYDDTGVTNLTSVINTNATANVLISFINSSETNNQVKIALIKFR